MRIVNLEKSYGARRVLQGLSLEIAYGEITCIIGKSGVGKTTLLNAIAGIFECGGEISPKPSSVGYVFQNDRLIPYLTVRENLHYVGGRDEMIDELLREADIFSCAERKAATLSGGEKRRLSLVRAFCVPSELVLLDEPFSALDTVTKERLLLMTKTLLTRFKKTAVLVTHDLDEAFAVADKIALLDQGKIVYELRLPASDGLREYGSLAAERKKLIERLREAD